MGLARLTDDLLSDLWELLGWCAFETFWKKTWESAMLEAGKVWSENRLRYGCACWDARPQCRRPDQPRPRGRGRTNGRVGFRGS